MAETKTTTEETCVEQFRKMKVGETLEFPIEKFNYCSNARYQNLKPERIAGMNWRVTADMERGLTLVTRTT